MRRLYFLLPDAASCRAVVAELEERGLSEHRIHVVASPVHDLEGLPAANTLQRSELAHGIEGGLVLGGLAALTGLFLVERFPPPAVTVQIEPWLYLVLGIGGAIFGAIASALLAKGIPNHKLAAFQRAIDQGELLVMVDVPASRVEETRDLVIKHHPEARIGITRPKK